VTNGRIKSLLEPNLMRSHSQIIKMPRLRTGAPQFVMPTRTGGPPP